jgi:hypothetical protein
LKLVIISTSKKSKIKTILRTDIWNLPHGLLSRRYQPCGRWRQRDSWARTTVCPHLHLCPFYFSISFVPREINEIAHRCASIWSLLVSSPSFSWVSLFQTDLRKVLTETVILLCFEWKLMWFVVKDASLNLSLPPFHPLAHVAVTLDPRKPYHSLTRPRRPYPCFLPRVRLYVATTTTKQSVTPPHNRCTVSKCGVGGNAGGWINYNVLIPLCLYGSCIKRLKVPMSCSLKVLWNLEKL